MSYCEKCEDRKEKDNKERRLAFIAMSLLLAFLVGAILKVLLAGA